MINMKYDYIIKLIDENYNTLSLNFLKMEDYVKKSYNIGFIDGYMNEEIYKYLVLKQEGITAYENGYKRGVSIRNKKTTKQVNSDKVYFISRLAFFDAMNNVSDRKLSDKAMTIYNDYKLGEFSLKTGKYISKSKL